MDILLSCVKLLDFKAEKDLVNQNNAISLPFHGMDKSMAAVCQFLNLKNEAECEKGSACPFRHIRGDRTIVCKHWLRGLCKKGDQCEFLHEFDMKKMPECYFYSRFNACHNKECPFLHIDPESKVRDCPWYDRGFCRHGPHCRHRHVRRVLCINYLSGFCSNGWNCKYMHPRFELPPILDATKDIQQKKIPTCHNCGELGHKASFCQKQTSPSTDVNESRFKSNGFNKFSNSVQIRTNTNLEKIERIEKDEYKIESSSLLINNYQKTPTPIEEITCYKCGHKGHYANKCPKGHLAFLSNQHSHK